MKGLILSALLVLSVSAASAQSMNSVLLHHVRDARLVVVDMSKTLSYAQIDTLRRRLETKLGTTGSREDVRRSAAPVLRLVIEEYTLKKGWYLVTMRTELTETVRRVQEPSVYTNAITWYEVQPPFERKIQLSG